MGPIKNFLVTPYSLIQLGDIPKAGRVEGQFNIKSNNCNDYVLRGIRSEQNKGVHRQGGGHLLRVADKA